MWATGNCFWAEVKITKVVSVFKIFAHIQTFLFPLEQEKQSQYLTIPFAKHLCIRVHQKKVTFHFV